MRTSVCGLTFELTDAIVDYAVERVRLSLGTAADRVKAVSVRLADINGTRGGVDKRCQIVVWLPQFRAIVTEAVDRDLYTAIDEAVARAKEALWRQLKRRQTLRREFAGRRGGLRRALA